MKLYYHKAPLLTQVLKQLTSEEYIDLGRQRLGLGATNNYLQLLRQRGFANINFDDQLLDRIAGRA